MSSTFRRTRNGEMVVHLHPEEVSLLQRLPDDLRAVIDAPAADADAAAGDGPEAEPVAGVSEAGGDPIRERLFPRAYLDPTEESAEGEWQRMVHPELVRSKLEALALLGTSLERARTKGGHVEVVLTPEEVDAWLGALNDARLALGIALGVTEEPIDELVSADDPAAPGFAVYTWLTGLQGELVDALLG